MRNLFRCGAAAILLAALAGLTACTAGGAGAPARSPTAMTDAQILAIGRELAQCIRDHGVPSFPDPTVDKGRLIQPAPEGITDEQVMPAFDACHAIADRLPPSATGEETVSAEDMQKLVKFAQCLRANGIPEWPDPKADGSFPIVGTPLEGKSERLMKARQPCQQYWDGPIRGSA